MRTGIAIIALGFVVARFGLALRLINPSIPPTSPLHFTDIIGIILDLVGGCMILLALRIFINNQQKIRLGTYTPTATIETFFSLAFFTFAIVIAVYLLWNI
jgi:putative membrane protein